MPLPSTGLARNLSPASRIAPPDVGRPRDGRNAGRLRFSVCAFALVVVDVDVNASPLCIVWFVPDTAVGGDERSPPPKNCDIVLSFRRLESCYFVRANCRYEEEQAQRRSPRSCKAVLSTEVPQPAENHCRRGMPTWARKYGGCDSVFRSQIWVNPIQ